MLEFSIVLPLLLILVMGLVDMALLLWHWTSAVKATQLGARDAVVRSVMASPPVNWMGDSHASAQFYATNRGRSCLDSTTGLPNTGVDPVDGMTKAVCQTFQTTCSGSGCGAGFSRMLARMQLVQPRLQPEHVTVIYASSGLGYVGQPNGNPMTVTVGVQCLTFELFFLDAWFRWSRSLAGCPANPPGMKVTVSSSLLSEGLSKPASEP